MQVGAQLWQACRGSRAKRSDTAEQQGECSFLIFFVIVLLTCRLEFNCGRFAEAAELEQELIEQNSRVNGAEHADTIWYKIHLASLWDNLGRSAEAVELRHQLVERSNRALGEDQPATVEEDSWDSLGRHADAAELRQQVVAQRMRVLGAEHPDTLASKETAGKASAGTQTQLS